jgi:hypothetical protein
MRESPLELAISWVESALHCKVKSVSRQAEKSTHLLCCTLADSFVFWGELVLTSAI